MTRQACAIIIGVLAVAGAGFSRPADGAERDLRLIDAVRNQDARAAAALVRQRVDVNATEPDGATALHWAAQWDDLETAALLLRSGASARVTNDYGVSPLWYACVNGSAPMIEALLKAGASPDAALPTGETALMTAARTGRLPAVQALLAKGADVNAHEKLKGQTALMWAVAERHADVAGALLTAGADVEARSETGFTALMFAARAGDVEMARALIDGGANLGAEANDGTGVLLIATVRGHAALATFLLDRGANPNAANAGYTALHWASGTFESSHTHDYKDVKEEEWDVLAGLPSSAKIPLIKALLAHGADVNAAVTRPPPRFGYVLFKAKYVMGATPFLLAATAADLEVMKVLLAAGATPLVTTLDHTTTLQVAAGMARVDTESIVAEERHLEAVKMLVALGADVNAANDLGNSALHAAAMAGFDTVAQFLLDRGAELNARNRNGETPLRLAEGYIADTMLYIRSNTASLLRKLGGTSD